MQINNLQNLINHIKECKLSYLDEQKFVFRAIRENMRISQYNYNNYNYKQSEKHIKFTGDNTSGQIINATRTGSRKLATWLVGLAALFNISCSDDANKRFSETEDINGIRVEYNDVHKETRDSIMKPVYELKSKLKSNNDFMDGIKISIASTYDSLKSYDGFNNFLKKHATDNMKGLSFYSDSKLPKRIFIQEKAHKGYETLKPGTHQWTIVPALRQSIMHEMGHQFDNFFGHDHNSDFAQKWDSIVASKEYSIFETPYNFDTKTDADKLINVEYNWNCGLSDKKEFHKAILEDLNNMRNIPQNSGILPENIKYYTSCFDFSRPITPKDVDLADGARAEIYANLFSYAIGQDEGEKKEFIRCFEKGYNVVKKDIAKYLRIK